MSVKEALFARRLSCGYVVMVKAAIVFGVPCLFATAAWAGLVDELPLGPALHEYGVQVLLTVLVLQQLFGFKLANGGGAMQAEELGEIKQFALDSHEASTQAHNDLRQSMQVLSDLERRGFGILQELQAAHAPTRHGDILVYDWKLTESDKAAIRSLPKLAEAITAALEALMLELKKGEWKR